MVDKSGVCETDKPPIDGRSTAIKPLTRTQTPMKAAIRNKISFMGKLAKMQRVLREERESILIIKAFNDKKLPQGILLNGKAAIKNFLDCKQVDMRNEMVPRV